MFLWDIALILGLVLLNGFFVSVEFAAVTSRRARIELLADQGSGAARIVQDWLASPAARDRLIAAAQLGITIASLALGAVGENTFAALLEPYFHDLALPPGVAAIEPLLAYVPLIVSLVIVTSLHVVLGEQVPKVAALHQPERFALISARPMQAFARVFKWFIDLLDWATRQVLRLVGLRMVGEHMVIYTVEEIKRILEESEEGGIIEPPEREMLHAIIDLGGLTAEQVMIPRTEIVAAEADTPLDELLRLLTQTNFTKFPLYDDSLDHVLGMLHVKDLLRAMIENPDWRDRSARSLAREAMFVPETMAADDLLHQFRVQRQHIAIVMDEYGGTAGLVTLEDLLEEIVGEVSDPFDIDAAEIQTLADGTALIDGAALIEDVNDHFGLALSDPHYNTIAGYVLGKLGRIPRKGDSVEEGGIRLRVEEMNGLRVARLALVRADPAQADDANAAAEAAESTGAMAPPPPPPPGEGHHPWRDPTTTPAGAGPSRDHTSR